MKREIIYLTILICFLILSFIYGESYSRISLALLITIYFIIFFRPQKKRD